MNSSRNFIQYNSQIRHMLKSMLQNRTVTMLHTRTFERVDMSCRFMGPRKLYSPLTWSMCNYAKKAGKDKKGICHSPLNIEVTGSVKGQDWAKISITFVIIFWLVGWLMMFNATFNNISVLYRGSQFY